MTDEVKNFGLEDFIAYIKPEEIYEDQVIVMEMDGRDQLELDDPNLFPLRFDAFSSILVCRGEAYITIDYMPYILTQHMSLNRSDIHVMNGFTKSHDFKGYLLILGKKMLQSFIDDIAIAPRLPREYSINSYAEPVHKLDMKEFNRLVGILERLRDNIRREDHFFRKALILNEVRNFTMETINLGIQRYTGDNPSLKFNYLEELVLRFLQLLIEKGKEWNDVASYSTELCVTPVYLSRTVKSVVGKTAIDLINSARISEAEIMLRKPDTSIQLVADALHFSDQSAFGKFFKRHVGISPMEYKNNHSYNKV